MPTALCSVLTCFSRGTLHISRASNSHMPVHSHVPPSCRSINYWRQPCHGFRRLIDIFAVVTGTSHFPSHNLFFVTLRRQHVPAVPLENVFFPRRRVVRSHSNPNAVSPRLNDCSSYLALFFGVIVCYIFARSAARVHEWRTSSLCHCRQESSLFTRADAVLNETDAKMQHARPGKHRQSRLVFLIASVSHDQLSRGRRLRRRICSSSSVYQLVYRQCKVTTGLA
jgi:hypothetical protein